MKRTYHTAALTYAFVINTLLTIVEYAAGVISGSAAIIGDGSQNLTDSLVLSIAFVSERLVARPKLSRRTTAHIYQIAGSLNALILIGLSCVVGLLAVNRILHPQLLNSTLVIAIGCLSIAINSWAASVLFRSRRDQTTKAPYIGLVLSGLSGIGVLLSGVAYRLWDVQQVDGITGLSIAVLLLIRSTRLLFSALTRHN